MESYESILAAEFPNSVVLHKYNTNTFVIKCGIVDLYLGKIERWKHNRQPDVARVSEICDWIYKTNAETIDWLLYMFYDETDRTFKIIDGLHRFCALRELYKSFGAEDVSDLCVMVSIRFSMTHGKLVDLFQSLNRAVPVAELYFENASQIKKDIVETVVANWYMRYPTHFSTTRRPNVPNTNRDLFADLVSALYDRYNITQSTAGFLEQRLSAANLYLSEHIPKKISEMAVDKCQRTNCYLFMLKNDTLLDKLL